MPLEMLLPMWFLGMNRTWQSLIGSHQHGDGAFGSRQEPGTELVSSLSVSATRLAVAPPFFHAGPGTSASAVPLAERAAWGRFGIETFTADGTTSRDLI